MFKILKPRLRAETVIGVPLIGLLAIVGLAIWGGASGSANQDVPSRKLSLSVPRVVILKSRRIAHLFDGDRLIRSYPIDLGIAPVGPKRRAGDGRTPEGSCRIVTKNPDSPFHRFLGIDYPNLTAAQWGRDSGLISQGEAAGIRSAISKGRRPNWGTALGGGIGLHGRRLGRDWTGGCIALSDHDIDELFSVLRIGDPVEILP